MKTIRNHQLPISLLIFYIIHSSLVTFCVSVDPDPVICKLKSLQYLDLSNNHLNGSIPPCLGNLSSLVVLKLQKNSFSGRIPQTFEGGSLRTLDLSHNKLLGTFPLSLNTSKNLEEVNLGHNFIADLFPSCLEFLPNLMVLVLRNNRFYGTIPPPTNTSSFSKLHIIDVSQNHFTGSLPSKNFESWQSMGKPENNSERNYLGSPYYSDSMIIINKGLEMELQRILIIFKAVDFSQNKFDGEIPMSIGRLISLRVLNLSRNAFTGTIPPSLANLNSLESLDLSHNQLSGKIPNELTGLTFLEALDLSYNNLTGIIPRGGQFETFPNAFKGNRGLFVDSPPRKNDEPSPTSKSRFCGLKFRIFKANGYGWEHVLMGYGCGLVLGLAGGCCLIQKKEEYIMKIFSIEGHERRKSKKAKKHHRGKQK